jgi:hypothetical protein
MIQIGTRNNGIAKKMVGQRGAGVMRQIGSRVARHMGNAVIKGVAGQLINDHNNADVAQMPKFQHTEPVKRKKNGLERI